MKDRPTSVTVFGILNMIFGGLGILTFPVQLLFLYGPPGPLNPMAKLLENNPGLRTWMEVSIWIGAPAAIALVAAGFGLFLLKPWGRGLSIIWGVYGIVAYSAGAVMNFLLVFPVLDDLGEMPEDAQNLGLILGQSIGTAVSCGYILYPILMIYFLTRPAAAAAFRSGAADDALS